MQCGPPASGDDGDERDLHLSVGKAAVLAVVGLREPRRIAPVMLD